MTSVLPTFVNKLSRAVLLLVLLNTALVTSALAETTVLITGANRGLGLEFVRQYADRGYKVIATARKPAKATVLNELAAKNPKIIVEQLDVTDHVRIDALAEKYKDQPIDILVNNAGITLSPNKTQQFGNFDYAAFEKILQVNLIGPTKMTEAFFASIEASEMKKIITVSSSMGSIKKTFGSAFFYRSSKAGVNMMMRSLARDVFLKLKKKGIIFGLVNPGPTDTDMMADRRGKMKLRDPAVATADMMRQIDNLTVKTSGAFMDYNDKVLPW
jgi:NAD(P)-dependent dehydrogenase (short-subunit alcohol dehydrogenase family)